MSVKIVKALSKWFKKNARTLPWRSNPDPYSVWLSEVMLQQTQVITVLPYFARFKKEFPQVQDLAKAHLDQVLKLWEGLGYYSRARNLHRGAQAIAERLDQGQGFPKNRDEWIKIPGVGPYTAGAVASIVHNERAAIVDGNVVRVLSRLYGIKKLDPKHAEIWKRSDALVKLPSAVPRVLNQALMELGALVCRPKNPDCKHCPLTSVCVGNSDPLSFPEKKKRAFVKKVSEEKWILFRENRSKNEVYLVQNEKGAWRAGLWDFPNPEKKHHFGKGLLIGDFQQKYVVTTHQVKRAHQVYQLTRESSLKLKGGKWFPSEALPALPSPVKKSINQALLMLKKIDE